jgi:hypothetical protein
MIRLLVNLLEAVLFLSVPLWFKNSLFNHRFPSGTKNKLSKYELAHRSNDTSPI